LGIGIDLPKVRKLEKSFILFEDAGPNFFSPFDDQSSFFFSKEEIDIRLTLTDGSGIT
jgi:hypothetical protein